MSNVLILSKNYLDPDLSPVVTYSSQLTAAPATNVMHGVRRTKTWRSAGYWEITSSNNVLKFRETTGVDLTATVAVSNYTTDAAFLAAIKTALQAVGGSTYTVSRDVTTNRIKIASNGIGGGGIFQIRSSDVLSTLASVIGYDTGSPYTGALSYTADVLKIHTSEWIKFDLGITSLPQAFALLPKLGEVLGLTESATIKLYGADADSWASPQYSLTCAQNDEGVVAYDVNGLPPAGHRWWMINIQDQSNPNGYIEISKAYLGDIYFTSRGAASFPLQMPFTDLSSRKFSEAGVGYSDRKSILQSFDVNWNALTTDETGTLEEFFRSVGTAVPFMIVLDPNSVYTTDSAKRLRYVTFAQATGPVLQRANFYSWSWQLREEA